VQVPEEMAQDLWFAPERMLPEYEFFTDKTPDITKAALYNVDTS
jgi:hypothetical protein